MYYYVHDYLQFESSNHWSNCTLQTIFLLSEMVGCGWQGNLLHGLSVLRFYSIFFETLHWFSDKSIFIDIVFCSDDENILLADFSV